MQVNSVPSEMKNTLFCDNWWTCLFLDKQTKLLNISNPDEKLFFGIQLVPDKDFVVQLATADARQTRKITNGIIKAQREKRTVYLEYTSQDKNGASIPVSAHAQYRKDGLVCFHAIAIDANDFRSAREATLDDGSICCLQRTINENLPIGLEIYNSDGELIDINSQQMRNIGITNKENVLGINIFKNPNIPEEIKVTIKAGKNVRFTADYDFKQVGTYFHTTQLTKKYFDTAISVVYNNKGEVEQYLLTAHDITDRVKLQQDNIFLYNRSMTILNSLPVGVEFYDQDGTLIFLSDTDCRIFGTVSEELLATPLNLYDNPNLPQQVKDAVRRGEPIQSRFPYSFKAVCEKEYYSSSQTNTIIVECNGCPIYNTNGKLENYVFIVDDVTKAVEREEELRQSKLKSLRAMQDADIMLWEFDVEKKLFFCENEPMNGYNPLQPITVTIYTESIHPEDRHVAQEINSRMLAGDDWSFKFETRVIFHDNTEWQYCTISGSPFEKDAQGKVIKYVGTRKNNTELQRKKLLQDNILNSIPLPIHIKDIENDFRYVFCNDESRRMLGTSDEKTAYDVMSKEQVAKIEKTDKEVFNTGKPYFGLETIELKNGCSFETFVRKSIIYDNGKRLLLNVRWDQSLQNDLQRRAKVLSMSMNAIDAYTWFYEVEKDRISFGDGFERQNRDSMQINTLESFFTCVHPDDKKTYADKIQELIEKESGELIVEYRVDLTGKGEYQWWEERGFLETTIRDDIPHKYMFGMSVNIEAHKQTELTLQQNKEDLKQLIRQNELVLNNTNSGLAYITTDFIVQWENVSICSESLSYEAYKTGELCYKSAQNRNTPCENCVMQRALHSRQMECIKFMLNNNQIVEIFATPVFNQNNGIDGIVIRVDNVTERERIITELKQAKAQAEQSDKLKSAFLANMSHEIRTPLNAIVGFSELLISAHDNENREEYIQIININNELLLKLISDILDLSKIEAGALELKYEDFDLVEYFDDMVASMRQRISNSNVRLIADNPYSSCRVRSDRNRIAQIITNYVTNAIKYTPKGFIEMGYEACGNGIRFYVKDSGIGISPDKKDKVFHRFEKLDEFAQGTGLGLSICKAIAESMGGSVGFESTHQEGSLFWAILPCEPEINGKNMQDSNQITSVGDLSLTDEQTEVAATKERKTILIAEDIASNYLLVSILLKNHFNLLHALNGQQAVEMAKKERVDLLLMDMKMPVMNGLVATEEIRKFNKELPIVALTAHAFEADRQAALAVGCNDYLIKPIDKGKLMSVLQKYCGNEIIFPIS